MAKADEWDYGGALRDFQRAVEVDPEFALAHVRIAEHGEWVGRPVEERKAAMQAAVRNLGALPVKERLLVEAWKAHHDGREGEAERLHASALEAYPQDLEVLTQAVDLYVSASRWEEGLALLRRLLALDPANANVRFMLWECLGALDLADERLVLARGWADQSPGGLPRLVEALGDAGQRDEAIATARRAVERDDRLPARRALGEALLRAGRHPEAEAVLRPLADPARTGGPSVGAIMQLAAALDYQGRRREAMAAVASIPIPADRDYHRLMHAFCLSCRLAPAEARRLAQAVFATGYHANEWLPLHLLMQGDDREAAALAARFGAGGPGMRQYRALLAWREGEREQALAELQEMARRGPSYSRPSAVYLLATIAREEHRHGDLLTLVEALGRAMPSGWHAVAYPEAVLWAAEAHERLGDRDRARARIEQLLGWWRRADPDLPLLAEAKALCRRLGCQPRSPEGKP
jgi:tetratricopeptide (TPR) repeat protein